MKESRKNLRTLIIIIAVVVIVIICEFIYMAVRDAGNSGEETDQTAEEVSGTVSEEADSASLIAQARSLISQEDYDEAIEVLTDALAKDEMNAQIYQLMADAYFGLWEFSDMEEILLQGYEKTGDESLHNSWIDCLSSVSGKLIEDEDYEEAVDWIIKLIDADGETDERMYDLGLSFYMTEEYEEAINSLEKADTSDPEINALLIDVKIRYGEECYDENDYDEAVTQLKEVIEMDPDSIEAYTLLIGAYIDDGMYTEAKTYIDQGMSRFVDSGTTVDSDFLDAFLETSSSYYAEQEDVEGGLVFWQKVIELRPDNPLYQEELASYRAQEADESFVRGEELLDAGNPTAAETYFRQSYSLTGESLDTGIIESDSGIYCLAADGSLVTGWYEDEVGQKYYFYPIPGNGYARAVTGWQSINNEEFYFDEDGVMVVDDYAPDGRYLGVDGRAGIDPDSIDDEDEDDEDEDDFDEDENEEDEYDPGEDENEDDEESDTGADSEEEEDDNAPNVYIRRSSETVGPGF